MKLNNKYIIGCHVSSGGLFALNLWASWQWKHNRLNVVSLQLRLTLRVNFLCDKSNITLWGQHVATCHALTILILFLYILSVLLLKVSLIYSSTQIWIWVIQIKQSTVGLSSDQMCSHIQLAILGNHLIRQFIEATISLLVHCPHVKLHHFLFPDALNCIPAFKFVHKKVLLVSDLSFGSLLISFWFWRSHSYQRWKTA